MHRVVVGLVSSVVIASLTLAAPPVGKDGRAAVSASVDNDTYIDANNILMFVTNHGSYGRDLAGVFGQDAGTFFPYLNVGSIEDGSLDDYVLYAAGLWIGGKVGGETRVTIAEYSDEYVPGPMRNGTCMADRAEFRVYKLYSDSLAGNPNEDYRDWPEHQGAPVDSRDRPLMRGDQMLWTVYNDAAPAQHNNDAGSTAPLGIEVRQTWWASAGNSIVHTAYELRNKGGDTIADCYLGLWFDPDLGDHTDDLVGCDTLRDVFFAYNGDNNDAGHYYRNPPAIGVRLVSGPLVPSPGDTAVFGTRLVPGFRNLRMTAFTKYINGTDPNDFNEACMYLKGLNANGAPYVYEGRELRFMHSGDPVMRLGDIDMVPSDRRMMASCGPFTFLPGDSQYVQLMMAVGLGSDRLSSLSALKSTLGGEVQFICGDVDASGRGPDIVDLVFAIDYVFHGGAPPSIPEAADVSPGVGIDVADLTRMVNYLFSRGPALQCR